MAGKNARKFFEDSHEYREQKNGGIKNAQKIFYNHNNVEHKKLILRNAPKRFLDSHESRKQKNGANGVKIFFKFLTNNGSKKIEEKKRANFF